MRPDSGRPRPRQDRLKDSHDTDDKNSNAIGFWSLPEAKIQLAKMGEMKK